MSNPNWFKKILWRQMSFIVKFCVKLPHYSYTETCKKYSVTVIFLLYISYKTTIFQNIIPNSILVRFWWNFYQQNFVRSHRYLWTGPSPLEATGTCGHDPPPFFLNIDFFSCKQHFATFYVSLYDIHVYTINTIKLTVFSKFYPYRVSDICIRTEFFIWFKIHKPWIVTKTTQFDNKVQ